MEKTAKNLNRKWEERKDENPRSHPSHLVTELLEDASRRLQGFGVESVWDEEKNIDIQYVNMGDTYNLTVLYDKSQDRFFAAALGGVVEEKEREHERRSAIDTLRQEAEEGLAVYIGQEQYYVRNLNKFVANLYKMAELDLFQEIFDRPVGWDTEKDRKNPFSLMSDIRRYSLPVTDYFLDVEDFRDAVTGNTRNSDLIRKMRLEPPEQNAPLVVLRKAMRGISASPTRTLEKAGRRRSTGATSKPYGR
jgi:hypothetical protein